LIAELPAILERAVHLDAKLGNDPFSNTKLAHQYGARVVIDGVPLYLSIIVKERYGEFGSGLYYDTFSIVEDQINNNSVGTFGSDYPKADRNYKFNLS